MLKIVGKFIIAKFMDGFTFLIEMKEDYLGVQIQIGEGDVWNWELDADTRSPTYCI